MPSLVRCSLLAFVLMAAGCSWGWRPLDQPTPVKRADPVGIWTTSGRVETWHAVVITQDSVSGIPYEMSVSCDSCRRSIPRTRVDSMKLGYLTVAKGVKKGAIYAGLVVAFVLAEVVAEGVVCRLVDPGNGQC